MNFNNRIGTLASQPSCRDKGRDRKDAGALCLSSSDSPDSMGHHHTPTESPCDEDKHKAPTHPHIHPLSLQDGGGHFPSLPHSGVKIHQVMIYSNHVMHSTTQ